MGDRPETNQCIISLDLGTTFIKAFAYTPAGRQLTAAKFQLAPDDNGRQDAALVYAGVVNVLKQTASALNTSGINPVCISVSGAMHSMLPVDINGKPLSAARLWSDAEGASIAATVRPSKLGADLYIQTGTPVHPMSPLIKLARMKEAEPDLFRTAFKFISLKEYVLYHLTGHFFIDYSIASATGLFNSCRLDWSQLALDYLGIDCERLGAAVSPYYQTGFRPGMAASLGFKTDFPVIAGASDGCLASLGAAPLKPGNICLSMGTSAAIRSSVSTFNTDSQARTFTYLLDETHFISGGPSNSSGAVYTWLLALVTGKIPEAADYALQNSLAEGMSPGAGGLTFLPYIFGERAPLWDPEASGSFTGIKHNHTRAHFARAVMEGILFNLRYIFEVLEEKTVPAGIFTGGGLTVFPIWLQLLSNVLNRPLHKPSAGEDSATGAALIGMKSMGIISTLEDQAVFYSETDLISPEPGQAEIYEPLYQKFKAKIS